MHKKTLLEVFKNECVRNNDEIAIFSTGKVIGSMSRLEGLVQERGGRVYLTDRGYYHAHAGRVDFLGKHPTFKERGAYFVAPNGTRVLKRSIPKSMIQKMPDGGYVAKQNIVVVSGDILPAVKAFVEMLENARDRRES